MAAKMLDEVLEKEKQTAQKETEASTKADDIIESAKAQAKAIADKAESDAAEFDSSQVRAATEHSDKAVEQAVADAEKYASMLKEQANGKFSEAVGVVRSIIAG